MNVIEKKSLEFIKKLQIEYLANRNIKGVLDGLTDDIRWIGTGKEDRVNGIEQAEKFLTEETKYYPLGFQILESNYEARAVNDTVCLIQGSFKIQEKEHAGHMKPVDVRISAVCVETALGIKLKDLHMSSPNRDQSEDEIFPRILSITDDKTLRKYLDEQSAELIRKNRDLNALMKNVPGGVICCDNTEDLNLIEYSAGFLHMFGYTQEEMETLFHNKFKYMICPEDLEPTWESVREQLSRGNAKKIEYRVVCKDGSLVTVQDHGQLVNRDGEEVFYCILTDVTESRDMMKELRLSLERHRIIMEQTTDIIFEWDLRRDYVQFSDNWEKKFGYKPYENGFLKKAIEENIVCTEDLPNLHRIADKLSLGTVSYVEDEVRILKIDGTYIWCKIRATLQVDEKGRPKKAIGVIVDIDDEKKKTQQLKEQAQRDTLTGLYNKGTTERFAKDYLANMRQGQNCAIIIIDIDNFKYVNDVYGHLSGDVLLTEIAYGLKGIFRRDDIIGRIGGDEFVVVMKNVPDMNVVKGKAAEIIQIFDGLMENENSHVSCSIGIAVSPNDGKDFDILYRKADTALYYMKVKGKNGYKIFTPDLAESNDLFVQRMAAGGNAAIDSDRNVKIWENKLAEYVFYALYRAEDKKMAIEKVLEIVGKQLDISRVYIFEELGENMCGNTFEWCNTGVRPQKDSLQAVKCDRIKEYLKCFDKNGVFYCRNAEEFPELVGVWIKEAEVKSTWQCLIKEGEKTVGFIGFDECTGGEMWSQEQLNTLELTAKIINTFLVNSRQAARLEKQKR